MDKKSDVIVIGGGPAGYTAALYTTRAGLSTLVIEKLCAGGQMTGSPRIENYPGFPDGTDGFSLGESMRMGAERFGAVSLMTEALAVEPEGREKTVETGLGRYSGRVLIVATGAVPRTLGLEGEEALAGRGLAYCAACDGMFCKGRPVAVVGGGSCAARGAMLLSRVAARVYIIHRRDALSAERAYHRPLAEAENIGFIWNSTVSKLLYGEKLRGVELTNVLSGEKSTLELDGLFVSIGRSPDSDLFRGRLDMDAGGYIVAGEDTVTSLPGVFAAGDVRTKALRQIVTAAADGAMAAHRAEEYLAGGLTGFAPR